MNENKNKNPRRRLWRVLWTWLICFVAMAGLVAFLDIDTRQVPPYWQQFLIAAVGASLLLGLWLLVLGLWLFVRWACNRRNFGRLLIGLAVLATLIAIFYLEEDWRGKRAWEKCKAELEAKGAVLDWEKFIPPPVPDDQNFFTTSTNILLRFVKQQNQARMDAAAQLPGCGWGRPVPIHSRSSFLRKPIRRSSRN